MKPEELYQKSDLFQGGLKAAELLRIKRSCRGSWTMIVEVLLAGVPARERAHLTMSLHRLYKMLWLTAEKATTKEKLAEPNATKQAREHLGVALRLFTRNLADLMGTIRHASGGPVVDPSEEEDDYPSPEDDEDDEEFKG